MGVKTGKPKGRPKGSPNKKSVELSEKLSKMGCDPIEGMARLALQAERDAETAFGDLVEKLKDRSEKSEAEDYFASKLEDICETILHSDLKLILDHRQFAGTMLKELAQYVAPKRKSVELSGEVGTVSRELTDTERAERLLALVARGREGGTGRDVAGGCVAPDGGPADEGGAEQG